jgi:hypothetical protein
LGQAESLALAGSLLGEIQEEKSCHGDPTRTKSYLATRNILYVRDAIRKLDKKKSAEIDKMWRSYKHDIKTLLNDIKCRLEHPEHPKSSSPILQRTPSPTSSQLYD